MLTHPECIFNWEFVNVLGERFREFDSACVPRWNSLLNKKKKTVFQRAVVEFADAPLADSSGNHYKKAKTASAYSLYSDVTLTPHDGRCR